MYRYATDPENFIWERDKVSIVTMAPGLYEVTFGFFVRKKPAIQLLVNGEPVLAVGDVTAVELSVCKPFCV